MKNWKHVSFTVLIAPFTITMLITACNPEPAHVHQWATQKGV